MANNSINVNFAQSDVQEIRMGDENTLEIILKDGSVVGYTDMDTASSSSFLMFSDGKALEIASLVDTLENGEAWNILDSYIVENIVMPLNGGTENIALGQHSIMHFDFDLADAMITQNENTLEIDMGDAGSIVVSGVNGMEAIQLANGEVVDLNILLNGSTDDVAPEVVIYADAQDAAEQVANIEPASGDIAEQLAAIEPAAGDAAQRLVAVAVLVLTLHSLQNKLRHLTKLARLTQQRYNTVFHLDKTKSSQKTKSQSVWLPRQKLKMNQQQRLKFHYLQQH